MTLADEQIGIGLSGGYGGIPQSWTFEQVTVDGTPVADLSKHFLGATIDVNNRRAVRASARARITWRESEGNPVSLLGLYRITEHMMMRGEEVSFPLGIWILVGMGHHHFEDGSAETEITLEDFTASLIYSTTDGLFNLVPGDGYFAAMRAILSGFGVDHDLVWQGAGVEPVLPISYSRPTGTPYYTILKDLADGINYEVPWPDLEGTFVTAPILPPEDEPFTVVYRDDQEPRMIAGDVTVTGDVVDIGSLKNGCVAKIDNPFRREWAYVVRELELPPDAWRDISIESDGEHVWVLSSTTAYRINVADWQIVNSWGTPASGSRGIAVEADGTHVWISDTDGNIYRRLASDGSAVSDITLVLDPAMAIAIEPAGDFLWAVSRDFPFVVRLDVTDGSADSTTDYPYNGHGGSGGGVAVEPAGAHLWVGENTGFHVVRRSVGGSLVFNGWATPGTAPTGIALDPDGEHLWLVTSVGDTVYFCTRDGLNDYGFVRYRNADPASPVSTANRPEDTMVLDSDSDPSTRLIFDEDTAAAIAITQLKREASANVKVDFETLPDPRRWINETYFIVVDGVDAGALRVTGWSRTLEEGAPTRHHTTAARTVEITEVS